MNIEELRNYCMKKTGVTESFPFGENTLVFKANGKMFLATHIDEQPLSFNAKCEPQRAIELREHYEAVQPGYHMNKKHWNTVTADGSMSDSLLYELIDHSYELVRGKSKPAKAKSSSRKKR